MIAVWPTDLPKGTLIDGFRSGTRGARLSTAVDTGPPKMRRLGIKLRRMSFAEVFTANERARFDRFWEEEINSGVNPFLYPDPHFDGITLGDENGTQLQDDAGVGLVIESWLLCQFGKNEPAWTAMPGARFAPLFDIVVLP